MKWHVEVSAEAEASIREYVQFIAVKRKSPLSAERWLQQVRQAIDSLEVLPRRCPLAPENSYRPYEIRMRVVGDYLLLFTVNDSTKTVHVIAFRHGHKQPLAEELPILAPE